MNVHQIRDLILKIIGVYCLIVSFSLIQVALYSMVRFLGTNGAFVVVGVLTLPMIFLWIGLTWVLLRRTNAVRRRIWPEHGADNDPVPPPKMTMAFWVAVVGLYAFLQSVDNFAEIGWRNIVAIRSTESPSSLLGWAILLMPPVLSAVCVLRAREIGAWISTPLERGAAMPTQDAPTEPGEDA